MDYYLRTNTEQEMRSALVAANLEGLSNIGIYVDIDHIGPIFWADGTTDSRWHTNIRASVELPNEIKEILPILNSPPSNPIRIFC